MSDKKITVCVAGGVVQSVGGIPFGVEVEIQNFDDDKCNKLTDISTYKSEESEQADNNAILFDPLSQIALFLSIKDIQDDKVRPDLSDEQAFKVLQRIKDCYDCVSGVSRDSLIYTAEELFPEKCDEEAAC